MLLEEADVDPFFIRELRWDRGALSIRMSNPWSAYRVRVRAKERWPKCSVAFPERREEGAQA